MSGKDLLRPGSDAKSVDTGQVAKDQGRGNPKASGSGSKSADSGWGEKSRGSIGHVGVEDASEAGLGGAEMSARLCQQ